jgi:hypothetical protein
LPIGLLLAINVQIFQLEPAPAIKPLCKDGINPDFTKEDLPLPDEPITAKNFTILSFFINSSTCFSLQKTAHLHPLQKNEALERIEYVGIC